MAAPCITICQNESMDKVEEKKKKKKKKKNF